MLFGAWWHILEILTLRLEEDGKFYPERPSKTLSQNSVEIIIHFICYKIVQNMLDNCTKNVREPGGGGARL